MRLLADCGNSTIKLGLAHAGGVWLHERCAAQEAALDAFLAPHAQAVQELVILPGSRASADLVERWWRRVGAGRRARTLGRELAVPDVGQYASLGLDRLAAGVVAVAQARGPVVVVDAGTATTLTAWRLVPGNAGVPAGSERGPAGTPAFPGTSARFAGGLILPGARACIAGLAAQAPALPAVEPRFDADTACQRDTPGAIGAAVGIGYGAMVGACLARLRADSGIDAVLVTGGAAQPLLGNALPRAAYRPSLVLEGLEALCVAADSA